MYRKQRGEWYSVSEYGTYPVNDGNPENDDPDFDEELAEKEWQEQEDRE